MTTKKLVLDTNILLANPNYIKDNYSEDTKFVIPMVVQRELTSQKSRGNEVAWKARKVLNALLRDEDLFSLDISAMAIYNDTGIDSNDEKIVLAARDIGGTVVSMDKDVKLMCNAYGVPCEFKNYTDIVKSDHDFKGIKIVKAGITNEVDQLIADFMSDKNKNIFELRENQYLILETENKGKVHYSYYKLKKGKVSKVIPYKDPRGDLNPKNPEQVCALDLLFDDDVPIKIITGVFGSGKTYLGINSIIKDLLNGEKADSKIMVLRQAEGDSESREVGFLKGTFEDKTKQFFKPIMDNIGMGNGGALVDTWVAQGRVEFNIPYFMKGRSLHNYKVLVDEAEDLTIKTVKLLGSRLGEGSSMIFCGDYRQTEGRYENNNGLLYLIDKTKDSELVGYVNLEDDIRSEASKLFADL